MFFCNFSCKKVQDIIFFCIFATCFFGDTTFYSLNFPTTNLHIGTEKHERTYKLKEIRHNGVDSPLVYRGSARPVVGMVVCAVHLVRML